MNINHQPEGTGGETCDVQKRGNLRYWSGSLLSGAQHQTLGKTSPGLDRIWFSGMMEAKVKENTGPAQLTLKTTLHLVSCP